VGHTLTQCVHLGHSGAALLAKGVPFSLRPCIIELLNCYIYVTILLTASEVELSYNNYTYLKCVIPKLLTYTYPCVKPSP
jgi:hypothetical protein